MRSTSILSPSAGLSFLVLFSLASSGLAQCQTPAPILSPAALGQSGQTRAANFITLVDSLYQSPATQTLTVSGTALQVPPWFDSSTECGVTHLKSGFGLSGSPSFTNYLVVSDELSELAIVTALANRDDRMLAIHHTVEALGSTKYAGMPCWIAKVTDGVLSCLSQDTASDATARFGLAYYFAANNPSFPAASRSLYRAAADALASRHLEVEYASGCFRSAVTGRTLCKWAAGGGDVASSGVDSLKMWIGYHQDIARFLIAAYQSTGNPVYLQRAEDVVDQWLMASTFSGGALTVGRFNFQWDTGSNPLQPRPGDPDYWNHDPVWDAADAPRALWMGDVLRAIRLSRGAVPASGPYAVLLDWVGKMQAADGQPSSSSCIQFNHDGTPYVNGNGESNCGHDYYYNGLGVGLHASLNTGEFQPKLDEALGQFGWGATTKTWNSASCFGIYRGIRPVKALATAIGLDASTYVCNPSGGGNFYAITPCRVLDTRNSSGPYGGPALTSGVPRLLMVSGQCGIPSAARAVAVNATVVNPSGAGYLTFYPGGQAPPVASTLSFAGGQVLANNALLQISSEGELAVRAFVAETGQAHLVLDVVGYFD